MRMHPARLKALCERRLFPHPIPCLLVKNADGMWVESPWFLTPSKDN